MSQCKNTLFVVPYNATETLNCPFCHNESKKSQQNVVFYSKDRKPFLKYAQRVRKCNICNLYFMNRVSLSLLKDNMKRIAKKVERNALDQQEFNPIIVKTTDQSLDTLRILMRKSNLSTDEFDVFLKTYLSEISAPHMLKEQQRKRVAKKTPIYDSSKVKTKSKGRKCQFENCNDPAIAGKPYCWYHYQEENYRSK